MAENEGEVSERAIEIEKNWPVHYAKTDSVNTGEDLDIQLFE